MQQHIHNVNSYTTKWLCVQSRDWIGGEDDDVMGVDVHVRVCDCAYDESMG